MATGNLKFKILQLHAGQIAVAATSSATRHKLSEKEQIGSGVLHGVLGVSARTENVAYITSHIKQALSNL